MVLLRERADGAAARQLGELDEDRTRLAARLDDQATREHELRAQLAGLAEEVARAAAESARQERVVAELEDTIKARREVAAQNKQVTLGLLQDEAGRRAECEGARARLAALAERRRAAAEQLAARRNGSRRSRPTRPRRGPRKPGWPPRRRPWRRGCARRRRRWRRPRSSSRWPARRRPTAARR